MYLVDKQHVAGVQIRQQRGKVAGLFDCWAGGDANVHSKLVCNNCSQRCFTQPGRPVQQNVVERFLAQPCSLNENRKIFLGFFLTDVLAQAARAQRVFHIGVLRGKIRAGDPVLKIHFHIFGFYGMA